jgi:tRNA/tmRNA/rRNA uracil-C5-methylase (TrmA/RlmC/RlmD family)
LRRLSKSGAPADYSDFLGPHLEHDPRLLDVGCGQGTIALGLAQTVAQVDAVDPAEDAFADAQHYAAEHEIRNVEFQFC